jgi:hypothetical protein
MDKITCNSLYMLVSFPIHNQFFLKEFKNLSFTDSRSSNTNIFKLLFDII